MSDPIILDHTTPSDWIVFLRAEPSIRMLKEAERIDPLITDVTRFFPPNRAQEIQGETTVIVVVRGETQFDIDDVATTDSAVIDVNTFE